MNTSYWSYIESQPYFENDDQILQYLKSRDDYEAELRDIDHEECIDYIRVERSRQLFTSDNNNNNTTIRVPTRATDQVLIMLEKTRARDSTYNQQLTSHNTIRQHYQQQPPAVDISAAQPLQVQEQQPSVPQPSPSDNDSTGQPFPFETFDQHVLDPVPTSASSFQPADSTYYDDLMKDFAPHRKVNLNVTRSEVPSNPTTSQCKLRSLDFDAVQKFIDAFVFECGKFLGEFLPMVYCPNFPILTFKPGILFERL
jgi:hypothetical protein